MKIRSACIITFSPTGSSRTHAIAASAGLGVMNPSIIDITAPSKRTVIPEIHEDIVIVSLPVYEERIPQPAEPILELLQGKGTPVICIAVYGNIGYGITLRQMKAWAKKNGFIPVGYAAVIGEHSFSHDDLSIAKARPDSTDLLKTSSFAAAVKVKIESEGFVPHDISVPGRLPLMARILPLGSAKLFTHAPEFDESCSRCNACIKICPSGSIRKDLSINESSCMRCFACVRKCPKNSRHISLKKKLISKRVLSAAAKARKEPEFFL